jgi:hypothetical protein
VSGTTEESLLMDTASDENINRGKGLNDCRTDRLCFILIATRNIWWDGNFHIKYE